MGYGICRVMKVKSTAVAAMQYHNDRLPGEHSNPNIDPGRRGENVEFVKHGSYRAEVNERIERFRESTRKVRKDAVVLVEGVMTASPEFFEGKSRSEVMDYFRDGFEFVKSEFGEENLIHFTVHFDEVTPHGHFGATPIKDGRLSWKKFFDGRSGLKGWQDRFYEQVSSRYGLERGEQDTGRTHKDAAQMRRDAEREVKAMGEKADELAREVDGNVERLERLRREEEGIADEIAGLEKAEVEPVGESLAESAREVFKARSDGGRERELAAEQESLRSRIGELEGDRERIGIRISELRRGVFELRGRIAELGQALKERLAAMPMRKNPFDLATRSSEARERERVRTPGRSERRRGGFGR